MSSVHLLLVLLLLQAVLSLPSFTYGKKKKKIEKIITKFNFDGAVIGATNQFEVQIDYDDGIPKAKETVTREEDGSFTVELPLERSDTVEKLTVTVTSTDKLGGLKRRKKWEINLPDPSKHFVFFMGEFEPENRAPLFLRALFTRELPNKGESIVYLLRLTNSDGSKLYGSAEISNEQRTEWSGRENGGVIVKLNNDGVQLVQANQRPTMVLRLDTINRESECSICLSVFKEGGELTRQLHNCEHFFHESCLVDSVEKSKNRRNQFKCPVCAADIEFVRQTDEQTRDESPRDYGGILQRAAEIMTSDAEGNAMEKGSAEYITEEEFEQVRKQSYLQQQSSEGQTTGSCDFVYFKAAQESTLSQMWAFSLVHPVLQNGSGRPKFVYELDTFYPKRNEAVKMMFNQTMKEVDNLDIISMEKDVFDSADQNDADDGQFPPVEECDDDDPDLFAVRAVPDIDDPPSPPDSDEIAAGIRTAPIRQAGERIGTSAEQTENYGPNFWRTEAAQRVVAEQEKIHKQIQQKRRAPASNSSNAGSSNASPTNSWRTNSDTEQEQLKGALGGMGERKSAMAQNSQSHHRHGTSTRNSQHDDTPLWELLAQSTCSSWTEEQSAERAADEAQLNQFIWERRTKGSAESSPARSTPGRRRPGPPIPRPTHNYERTKTAENARKNVVPKEMPNEQQKQKQENEPGPLTALYNLGMDLKKVFTAPVEENEESKGKKHFGFRIKILPELEDKRREQFKVEVNCSWEKSEADISVEVNGNEAKVKYTHEQELLFYDIIIWKKSDGNQQNMAPFVEQRMQIGNNELYTFYMGAHFNLVINEADRQSSDSQFKYIAQVNCHGNKKSPAFRSDPRGNDSGKFHVFLPGEHCAKFDILVGKMHKSNLEELLERASEKGIKIERGETYRFKKALVNVKRRKNGKGISIERTDQTNKNESEKESESEMDNYADDPELQSAILESLREKLKRNDEQKMEQMPKKYGKKQMTEEDEEQKETKEKEEKERAKLIKKIKSLERLQRRAKFHDKKLEALGEETETMTEAMEKRKKKEREERRKIQQKKAQIEENSESEYETADENEKEKADKDKKKTEDREREEKERFVKEKMLEIFNGNKTKLAAFLGQQRNHSPGGKLNKELLMSVLKREMEKANEAEGGAVVPTKTKATAASSSAEKNAESDASSAAKPRSPSIEQLKAMSRRPSRKG
ncbi:hypothetical protein niasHT_021048 [Heterodera trifolii]|uniref:RING-type domain-containing protein n=1 Tax=Heterodera trifolii TaxID=157864 RepID=A0ABD2KCX1_9BILA